MLDAKWHLVATGFRVGLLKLLHYVLEGLRIQNSRCEPMTEHALQPIVCRDFIEARVNCTVVRMLHQGVSVLQHEHQNFTLTR